MSSEAKVTVPGSQGKVSVCVWTARTNGELMLVYYGLKEDLIATGAFTEEMFAPKEKRQARRVDSQGDKYTVERYWATRDGKPVQRYRVWRYKPKSRAPQLPGALRAITAYQKSLRDQSHWYERQEEEQRLERERQRQDFERTRRLSLPTSPTDWKDKETDSTRTFISVLCDKNIRRKIAEGNNFCLSEHDAEQLQELGNRFMSDYEDLMRSARVKDLRAETATAQRGYLQLVVNNGV